MPPSKRPPEAVIRGLVAQLQPNWGPNWVQPPRVLREPASPLPSDPLGAPSSKSDGSFAGYHWPDWEEAWWQHARRSDEAPDWRLDSRRDRFYDAKFLSDEFFSDPDRYSETELGSDDVFSDPEEDRYDRQDRQDRAANPQDGAEGRRSFAGHEPVGTWL